MKGPRNPLLAAIFVIAFSALGFSSAANIYITPNGTSQGVCTTNPQTPAWFNNSSNWGSGSSQIGPGTTVTICGAITTPLQVNGSGTSGNVIKFLWDAGARISVPYGQIININGAKSFLLFDGGVACGPGTGCDTTEAANQTGYTSGQAGIIEATANGSSQQNQNTNTQAFYGCNGCHDIEVRDLIIRNLYVHSLFSDQTPSADTGNFVFQCSIAVGGCTSGTISIHDSTIHDTGNAISIQSTSSTTVNVYNIDFYHNNWAMENSGNGTRTVNIYGNHFHDVTNWDANGAMYHHNGLHNYMNVPSDSVALNFYANLADGDWGTCCTTVPLTWSEVAAPHNFNIFNNVSLQACDGETSAAMQPQITTGVVANNTLIGCATQSGNFESVQLHGSGITYENNAIAGYGQYVVTDTGTGFTALDHNTYGPVGRSGNSNWQCGGTGTNTFSTWQSACSGDSHGQKVSTLGVDSSGIPQTGSALIGAGANLTNLCTGTLTPLCTDKAGNPRPSSGPWDAGAYNYGSGGAPNPPSGLTAIVN